MQPGRVISVRSGAGTAGMRCVVILFAASVGGALLVAGAGERALLAQPPDPYHLAADDTTRVARLTAAALERTGHRVVYDGSYRSIPYPGGDVPDSIGVCTDLIIRSYRAIGIDLQEQVHADMTAHFDQYPDHWGLTRPDPNIDHRRVPNLQVFFARRGTALPISDDAADYKPGELVTWMLPGNLPHIGIVVGRVSGDGERPLIVHNIGRGPRLEDVLFAYPLTGHYRYSGDRNGDDPSDRP